MIDDQLNLLFEDIAERVAEARTRKLMGEIEEARILLESACKSYERYKDVLAMVPGAEALQHSIDSARRLFL